MTSIRICNAALAYRDQTVFTNLNLDINPGHWTALLGPSGVGKSSLLKLLAGLMTKETFQATIPEVNQRPLSEQIAYMAQTDLLLPWLSVLDNVLLGEKLRGQKPLQTDKALHLLAQVKLQHAAKLYPHQLSGGMRQRAALARTLMADKPIVLMDEPFSALDAISRYKLQTLAAEVLKDKTVLFITHDPSEALRLANDIYIMQGKPATLKFITHLASSAPRDLNTPDLFALQQLLLQALTVAEEESA